MINLTNYINQKYEEKFKILEKNSLETEKNLINMNKDYAKTFNDIITKQKEGNDSEFQNIKHMIEIGLKKNQILYDNDINEMKKLISNIKGEVNENKSIVDKIDGFVKENMKIMNEYKLKGEENIIDFSKKIKQIEQDSLKLYEDTKNNILKELNDNMNKEIEKRNEFEKNINDKIVSKLHSYDNSINDLKEKTTQLKKMVENKYEVEKKSQNAIGINNLKFDEIYTNKFNNLNKDIQENDKKLHEELENKINTIKDYIKKNMDDYSKHVDDDLYKKIDVLSRDLKEKINQSMVDLDGKMQKYCYESELRLKNELEGKKTKK